MALHLDGSKIRQVAIDGSNIKEAWLDGRQVYSSGAEPISLADLPAGTKIPINENGVPATFILAQNNYIQSGVTAIERDLCLADPGMFNANAVNTYSGGTLDTFLTTTYRDRLDQNVRDALATVNIPVTSRNGNYNLTTIPRDVFVFSGTETGMAHQYMVVEGSRADIYSDDESRIKYSDDDPTIARVRWTRSAYANGTSYTWGVSTLGTAYSHYATSTFYIAPVLTLPSSTKFKITLGDLPTGSMIRINENGVPANFKIAQHDYIQAGVTAIERDLCLSNTLAFNSTSYNVYNGTTLDVFLTTDYRNRLDQEVRDELVMVNIPSTFLSGNDYILTTIPRDVFVLSGAEVGLSNLNMIAEGNKLDIYTGNDSRIKYSDDAPTTERDHWTRSAYTRSMGIALGVNMIGAIYNSTVSNSHYIAPVLTLPSYFPITKDMIVSYGENMKTKLTSRKFGAL